MGAYESSTNMAGNPELLTILDAAIFASEKHQGQVRKNKGHSPYITHPLLVAQAIYQIGGIVNSRILTAAILHDTLEDTMTDEKEIEARFGEKVLSIVLELTDDKTVEKMSRKRLRVIHASELSYEAKIVKLADKLVNCRDILNDPPEDWPLERRQNYIQWGADVVEQIRGTNSPLESAFDQVLSDAQAQLNFKIKPYDSVDQRAWGANTGDLTKGMWFFPGIYQKTTIIVLFISESTAKSPDCKGE